MICAYLARNFLEHVWIFRQKKSKHALIVRVKNSKIGLHINVIFKIFFFQNRNNISFLWFK